MLAEFVDTQKFWFPVALSQEVNSKPLARDVGGKRIVIWRDSEGQVAVLDNRCPHRGALLSAGEITSKGVRCKYHGITFDNNGRQADLTEWQLATKERPLCAKRFFSTERYGLVWISAVSDKFWYLKENCAFDIGVCYSFSEIVNASPFALLENLFDTTHFQYLHGETFFPVNTNAYGFPAFEKTGTSFIMKYEVPIEATGLAESFVHKAAQRAIVSIEYFKPWAQLFSVSYDTGLKYSSVQAILPIAVEQCRYFQAGSLHGSSTAEERCAFEKMDHKIWREDRYMIENVVGNPLEAYWQGSRASGKSDEHIRLILESIRDQSN